MHVLPCENAKKTKNKQINEMFLAVLLIFSYLFCPPSSWSQAAVEGSLR